MRQGDEFSGINFVITDEEEDEKGEEKQAKVVFIRSEGAGLQSFAASSTVIRSISILIKMSSCLTLFITVSHVCIFVCIFLSVFLYLRIPDFFFIHLKVVFFIRFGRSVSQSSVLRFADIVHL